MEHALQSLNIALVIQDKTLIRDLSLLLCDTIGQFDPVSSIMYLALSQVRRRHRSHDSNKFTLSSTFRVPRHRFTPRMSCERHAMLPVIQNWLHYSCWWTVSNAMKRSAMPRTVSFSEHWWNAWKPTGYVEPIICTRMKLYPSVYSSRGSIWRFGRSTTISRKICLHPSIIWSYTTHRIGSSRLSTGDRQLDQLDNLF